MPGFRRNSRTRSRVTIELPSKYAGKIIAGSIVIIIICVLILIIKQINHTQEIISKQAEIDQLVYNIFVAEDYNNIQPENIELPDRTVRIVSTGDILCENGILNAAYNKNSQEYEFMPIFEDVKKYIEEGDLTLASLETNFVDGKKYSGRGQYNAPLTLLKSMKSLGIDIVNTANNHSLDYGKEGIESTLNHIKEEGLESVGTYKTKEESEQILIKEIKGVKLAFLAYTYGITSNQNQLKDNGYSLNIIEKEKIVTDIKKAKEQGADFTFLLMHWGDVESSKQNSEQAELTNYLIKNGANIIIGTHPASIQPIEVRENDEGKNVFIAYSVGNLISSREYKNSNIEMILNIEIIKEGKTGETKLSKVTYTPIYLLDRGIKAEQRYKLIDVKKEIQNYEEGNQKNITRKEYERILQSLIDIDKLI